MPPASKKGLLAEIAELKGRLEEAEELINAIKAGEVDAFAINTEDHPEVYTIESGDYAYRVLVEEFGEGALTVTEEGLIVYTNAYFCELVGLSYDKVIGSYIFDLVHQGSEDYFRVLLSDSITGRSKGEIQLQTAARTIPVYISITSLRPRLPSLGIIITDLTQRKLNEQVILKYQKDLELKNDALTQTNEELASFAYIASHDLQEPLRKIQAISDLILVRNEATFSVDTKKYFDRMVIASRRMQLLIKALLDYSRFAYSEPDFVTTDLNQLLSEARENLQQSIDDSGATIEASPLPSVSVIPYQFVQLFSNIIQNAIKYRKPDVPPRIVITASQATLDQTALPAALPQGKYWKIKIADNGIGFDAQYANKVFELFQRLPSRPEIEGTGIGLPICKKVIQNHKGFIRAEGELGAGAVFIIYLPAGGG